jgi:hypothetical protein
MKVRRICLSFYNFCVAIPDYLYPFVEEIEGERVRWRAAYRQALSRVQENKGYGHYGAFLVTYRGLCHLVGATLFIGFAALVSRDLFGSDIALYTLLIMATLALAFQEFYLQPRTFGQMKLHSLVDLMSWIVPFGVFVFIHLH